MSTIIAMPQSALSNSSDTWEAVEADVRKYAAQAGVGANSRENFLMRCVKGGARGALSSYASKDKDNPDDARKLYMIYETTRKSNDAAEHDDGHNATTVTTKSSNFRTAIQFGIQFGEDAVATMNRAWAIVPTIPAKERRQPFECLNRVIVATMREDRVLDDDELRVAMLKSEDPDKKEKSAADYLREARKRAEQAQKLQSNSAVVHVLEAIDQALNWLPSA